jgi:hypothetical protein
MLSKYDAALLIASLLLFSGLHPKGRAAWRTPGPYATLAVAFLLFAPHLAWLCSHDFVTIRYLCSRSMSAASWTNRFAHPAEFFVCQLGAIAPMLLSCTAVLGWRWQWSPLAGAARFQRDYLLAVVLGPALLAIAGSSLTGAHLRSMWGAPMWSYTGVLVLLAFQPLNQAGGYERLLGRCAYIGLAMAFLFAARNVTAPYILGKPARVHFPGRAMAAEVERRWRRESAAALPVVGGDWWLAGNVAFYADKRLHVYSQMRSELSPWTSDEQLRRDGGIIVWQLADASTKLPAHWRARFPEAKVQPPIELPWATGAHVPPLRAGVALIPAATVGAPPLTDPGQQLFRR